MFETVRFLQNNFSITFARQPNIRRMTNAFEDALSNLAPDHYLQPFVIPIPDEFEPEMPRIVFGSKHGFSQIAISQHSVMLSVSYSPDWQLDIRKGENYLQQRVTILYGLLEAVRVENPFFSGLTTHARITALPEYTEAAILQHLARHFAPNVMTDYTYNLQFKITRMVKGRFFDNMTIGNWRTWQIAPIPAGAIRLTTSQAIERGIEVVGDYNDRYAFNEQPGYFSAPAVASEIISNGIATAEIQIERLRGEAK